jgi:hypothetical protein
MHTVTYFMVLYLFTFKYNDIRLSVLLFFYTRWDSAREWDDQYHNYQKIMDYVNSHPELGVDIQWGTLRQGDFTHFNFTLFCLSIVPVPNFYFYQQR